MTLKGTHGTSRSRAESILNQKEFTPSDGGYLGPGIYFWVCENSWPLPIELAELWWASANQKKVYDNCADKSCSVLKAEINISKDHPGYIDLTGQEYREMLYDLATKKKLLDLDHAELTAWFVDQIKQEMDMTPLVIRANVLAPSPIKGTSYALAHKTCRMHDAYRVSSCVNLITNIELHA